MGHVDHRPVPPLDPPAHPELLSGERPWINTGGLEGVAVLALDRMAREIAAVERMDEASAVAKIDDVLAKTARHAKLAAEADARTRAA